MVLPQRKITAQEYLEFERASETKHEFVNGEVYAMGGADPVHALIAWNVGGLLWSAFRGRPCVAYLSDVRVKVSATGLYTYPDVTALCGHASYEDGPVRTLLNPTLLVEVLSKSTESYDRGAKFGHYRKIESLTDYVLVSQDLPLVEHFVRQADGRWLMTAYDGIDAVLELASLNVRLPLADIYDKVPLTEE